MKKISYLLLGALGLTMASCANEDLVSNVTGDEANVSITLSTPQIQSRTYSDGQTATRLQYAVYKVTTDATTGTKTWSRTDYFTTNETINLEKQVSFKLVSGHTYGFVFWASSADAPYYVELNSDGAVMNIDYNDSRVCANNEKLDAFFAYEELYVTGDQAKTIYLYRPFAQINVGTSDLDDAKKAGYTPVYSHLTIDKVFQTLNLVTGEVSNEVENGHDYAFSPIPSGETFPYTDKSVNPNVTFDYLTMVYALVDNTDDQPVVEVEFCTTDADAIEHAGEHTVGSVPVKRNYRTNIFGQLLTSSVDVNVVIEPAYEKPDYLVNHDGVEYDAETSTFTITNAHGLEWISQRVNSNDGKDNVSTEVPQGLYGSPKCSFYGQKVVLANDIDMNECYGTRGNTIDFNFEPIGYQTNYEPGSSIYAFAGTFDGQDHTISNLYVSTDRNYNAGLFGYINNATIKNLTLKDVNINGHYKVGGLVADAHNSTIENVKVSGGTITTTPWEKTPGVWDDANNAGGIVGYYDNQPLQGAIKNCTVENVNITAFRTLGGLAGRIGARDDINPHTCGIEISGNTVSNVKLTADMTEVRYDSYAKRLEQARMGEIYGSKEVSNDANPNIDQNNSSSEVTMTHIKGVADESDLQEAIKEEGATIGVPSGNYGALNTTGMAKDVTIICQDGTVFEGMSSSNLNGGTIENATFRYNDGNASSQGALMGNLNGTFINCNFEGNNGARWNYLNGPEAKFVDCNFSGKAIYAFHIDSATAAGKGGTLYFEDCVFDGFVAIGSSVKTQFDNCEFQINSKSNYGGGNFWGPAVFNNCKFDLPDPEQSFRYIALATAGYTYEFNNCSLRNGPLTIDYSFPEATTGVIVKVDGQTKTIE